MAKIDVEKLRSKVPSVFKLVVLASRRAQEIAEGSPKMVEAGPKEKASLIALREIAAGKLVLSEKPVKKRGKKSA